MSATRSEAKKRGTKQEVVNLLREMVGELFVLRSAWVIAGDDDRRKKALYVAPSDVRRWVRQLERADLLLGNARLSPSTEDAATHGSRAPQDAARTASPTAPTQEKK